MIAYIDYDRCLMCDLMGPAVEGIKNTSRMNVHVGITPRCVLIKLGWTQENNTHCVGRQQSGCGQTSLPPLVRRSYCALCWSDSTLPGAQGNSEQK